MGIYKDILKIFSVVSMIFLIMILIIGFLVIQDAREFREKFTSEPNIFLLEDNGAVLAGARNVMVSENPGSITDEEAEDYQGLLGKKEYDGILGSDYKLFIVNIEAFDDLPEGNVTGIEFAKEDALDMLNAESARDLFIERSLKELDVPPQFEEQARRQLMGQVPSEQETRTLIFMMLLAAEAEKDGPTFLAKEYRAGNIDVYPRTVLFRVIEIVPDSMFEKVSEQVSMQK